MLPYPEESTIPSSPPNKPTSICQELKYDQNTTRDGLTKAKYALTYLKYFDTAFLIDDSDSMVRYWGEVATLLEEIAGICIEHDPNGIDIFFINHRPHSSFLTGNLGYKNIGVMNGNLAFHDSVAGIFDHVRPRGKCRLNQALDKILFSYLNELEAIYASSHRKKWIRPLNLIVITAGHACDNPYDALAYYAKKLDKLGAPPSQVGVQLFQVGVDGVVREKMEFAADGLHKQAGARNMVDTTAWSGTPGNLSAEAILKIVLGSVQKSIDKTED